MQHVELLAPAGTMDSLKAAVHNGCDAVYLGGTMFGARAFAGNFNEEEIVQAIRYAHLYDVKVYVTMNTLIYEDEIDAAYEYAKFLYEQGADAFIIQDMGLFDRLRAQLPDAVLHVSTQMHIHNKEGIRLLKKRGAQRIVLPRETSIEEVSAFVKEGVEIEVFVHGALCVSYSGQCLMSQALFERSGNRGECAQACRMKYRFVKEKNGNENYIETDGEYLLSPRDMNALSRVPELIEAGIASFKIEGRMKRPEYVAQTVAAYREAIDAYYGRRDLRDMEKLQRDLTLIFNRRFTEGYLFHREGKQLMHAIRPNHMGISIGRILRADKNKMTIRLQEDVHQGDGVRILQSRRDFGFQLNKIYKDGLLVKEAKKGETIELAYDGYVEKHAEVLKTSDALQLTRLQKLPKRTIPISMQAEFRIGQPMQLCVRDGRYTVTQFSDMCIEEAKTSFMSEERIKEQLSKCSDTPFAIQELCITADPHCFLSIRELNKLRRMALDTLCAKRMEANREIREHAYRKTFPSDKRSFPSCIVIVHTMEQYNACVEEGISPLYATSKIVSERCGIYVTQGSVVQKQDTSPLVWEAGGIGKEGGVISEPSLYAANSYTCAFLAEHGIRQILLPYEMSEHRMQLLTKACRHMGIAVELGVEIYGYRDMMISRYCPIQTFESGKKNCGHCRRARYYLEDIKGERFPLFADTDCHMHILSPHPYSLFEKIKEYRQMGITVHQLRFLYETAEEVHNILKTYKYFTES